MTEWYREELTIHSSPMQVFEEDAKCPACKAGSLKHNGISWPTSPPGYHHKCRNPECGKTFAIPGEIYPRIVYREI